MKIKVNKVKALLDLHFKTKRPLMLIGPAGVGKTSMVKQFAAEQGVKVYEYRAAYSEPGDLKGLCNADEKNNVMRFLRPEDFPPETEENCILFFDEINRASTGVMNCVLQATDGSGRIATHKLPKGCLVITAVNPDDANHTVNSMDFALINRFNVAHLEYDHSAVIDYARKSKWNPKVIGFMVAEKAIFSGDRTFDGSANLPTPRTLECLSEAENKNITDLDIHRITSCGYLGDAIGLQYHAYASGEQPLTVADLLDDTESSVKKAKKLSDPKGLRSDLISATNNEITDLYKSQDVNPENHKKIVSYFEVIPADLAAACLKAICNAKPEVIDSFQSQTKLMKRLGDRLKPAA